MGAPFKSQQMNEGGHVIELRKRIVNLRVRSVVFVSDVNLIDKHLKVVKQSSGYSLKVGILISSSRFLPR